MAVFVAFNALHPLGMAEAYMYSDTHAIGHTADSMRVQLRGLIVRPIPVLSLLGDGKPLQQKPSVDNQARVLTSSSSGGVSVRELNTELIVWTAVVSESLKILRQMYKMVMTIRSKMRTKESGYHKARELYAKESLKCSGNVI